MDMFLRALRFINAHRETRDGRSTIVYDLIGDPSYHAKTLEEKFAVVLTGRIWIDEQTGTPVEIRVQTDKDVKIAGGLVASVHKGFRVHVVQQLQPDGVWLRKSLDWSGDIREALFLHPRYRFSEEMDKCHLFGVNTQETHQAPKADAHGQK